MVTVPADVFMWINVGSSIFIIVCTFFLPETKGKKLIDKISEDKSDMPVSAED